MTDEIIILIFVLFAFSLGILFFNFIRTVNSDSKNNLSNITIRLAPEVQWKECTKTFISGDFQGHEISVALMAFNFVYYSYHITLHGKLKKQPVFMWGYPKLRENIEQRGNTLVAILAATNMEQEKSISVQVHETLKSMALLAAELEKNI